MPDDSYILPVGRLQDLVEAATGAGYLPIGPRLSDDAITYQPIETADDLPRGYEDEQQGGRYRLRKIPDDDPRAGALFRYVVGPQSWKQYLYPPEQSLWRAHRNGRDWSIEPPSEPPPRYAFFGVRACEIAAMDIQARVFDNGDFRDDCYHRRRDQALIIAVNCLRPAATCFCTSMRTGPRASEGYDLALTEFIDAEDHSFLLETGSDRGRELIERLHLDEAGDQQRERAATLSAQAAASITKRLPEGARETLLENAEHPHWRDVAERCLNCANCTMVCPTCFCSSVEDSTSLDGRQTERTRRWDSCFTVDFSYIHGGPVRRDAASRYRQWISHKLAYWHDQFGGSGCTGCGRCITWCPVGIDITEEVAALQRPAMQAQGES